MNCEEYVVELVKKLETKVDELSAELEDRESQIRKIEIDNVMLKAEKEQAKRNLDLNLKKTEDGELKIIMSTLYGWDHRDKPRIEELVKIFDLKLEDEPEAEK